MKQNRHGVARRIAGAALLVMTSWMAASPAYAASVSITATADAVVLDNDPRSDLYPGLLSSEFGTSGSGTVWLSVLKFDLSSVAGLQINSAQLELTSIFNHNSAALTHLAYSTSDDSWDEATVNGVNRPAESSLSLVSGVAIDGQLQTYSWDVLSAVQGSDALGTGDNVLTLLIRPDLTQAGTGYGPHFNDRTAATHYPRLLLEVSPSAVPEPSSALMFLAAGLAGLGRLAQKRAAQRRQHRTRHTKPLAHQA